MVEVAVDDNSSTQKFHSLVVRGPEKGLGQRICKECNSIFSALNVEQKLTCQYLENANNTNVAKEAYLCCDVSIEVRMKMLQL